MNILSGCRPLGRRATQFGLVAVVSLLSAVSSPALAEGEMTFKGTLIAPPPCKVDDSQTIEVNFGDRLGVNKVDGVAYARPLPYILDCEDTSLRGWKLTLTLAGTPAPFDATVFNTTSLGADPSNEANLGVRIYQTDGTTFTPGSRIEIVDAQHPPVLMAVPVKKSGATLVEGSFETLVTLQAHYQ